jgi:neutral ceramidase
MHVGVSEVDITPKVALPLAGMPGYRVGRGTEYPLKARAVVLDDGDRRTAIVTLDLLLMLASTAAELRQAVADGHGIDTGSVLVACSHTHSAPYVASLMDGDPDPGYLDLLAQRVKEAAGSACSALSPAVVHAGEVTGSGLTFNRRPVYRSLGERTEGEEVGTQGPHWAPDFIRIEGPTDEQAQFLWFSARDGRGLGGVTNFACHPTVVAAAPESKELYSADWPGTLTDRLRDRFGGPFGFLQGAAGQLWAIDMSRPEASQNYTAASAHQLGESVARLAGQARDSAWELAGTAIRSASRALRIPQRTVGWEQVQLARAYLERGEGKADEVAFTRAMYGHPFTFHANSPVIQEWFCREAIGMWEWQRRATVRQPLVEEVEVQVLAIGDVAIVAYPCELFAEHGLRTKQESPFRATIVSELSNGWFGYVPTVDAFGRGGYETRLGYQSRLSPEAGDRMVAAALEMLTELATENAGRAATPS